MNAASLILEIPEVRANISPVSIAGYHLFAEFNEKGRRTELVRGSVIEKTLKTPLHASIAKLLYDGIHGVIPPAYSVRQDQPLTLHDSEPEPDLAVVRGSVHDYRTAHPATAALVIEIAVSGLTLDREKAAVYAEAGVEEYWIVLPERRRVEYYRQPENGAYRETSIAEVNIACGNVPEVRFDLAELFG